jgi:hypothetical protein
MNGMRMKWALVAAAAMAGVGARGGQAVDLYPDNHLGEWTRIAIPPDKPISNIAQWHLDAAARTIVCDGNGGHEWLRYNHELGDFDFKVEWRFTPVAGTTKYNSGVFFRNNRDGSIWHQAQAGLAGGYIFGVTPVEGAPKRIDLREKMKENRVKAAGEWNLYEIRCEGANCSLAVNGAVVSEIATAVLHGYIGLESEGYRIEFRSLRLATVP